MRPQPPYRRPCAAPHFAGGGSGRIFDRIIAGQLQWIASTVLEQEIRRNPDVIRRTDTLRLLNLANLVVHPSPSTHLYANTLHRLGFSAFDALHLAVAQQANVDHLVTTDDRFLRLAVRKTNNRHPEIINPVDYLQRRYL